MDVIVAASLHKANEIIQAQDFDVLLSDLNADREGDGLEVLENLREVNPESVVPPYRLPAYKLPAF
jgi:DNA-binding NtrC family response regulator